MGMNFRKISKKLKKVIERGEVITDAPMREYTSFKAGGEAKILVVPADRKELSDALETLSGEECMVTGNGTNILVKDGGYSGVFVKIGDSFNGIRVDGERLTVEAGALLSQAAKAALSFGLSGLEFASGIPGSVGGAVFMNAGAYGGEIVQILEKATVMSKDGSRVFEMTNKDLELSYRHSRLYETGDVVLDATFKLSYDDKAEISARMGELAEKRNSKQPVEYPSAGSFFKRPPGYFAGKLIQDAGLKGVSVGGAQVSELHSGFIINTGGATATDICQLKDIVTASVKEKFGVDLIPEVRIVGED